MEHLRRCCHWWRPASVRLYGQGMSPPLGNDSSLSFPLHENQCDDEIPEKTQEGGGPEPLAAAAQKAEQQKEKDDLRPGFGKAVARTSRCDEIPDRNQGGCGLESLAAASEEDAQQKHKEDLHSSLLKAITLMSQNQIRVEDNLFRNEDSHEGDRTEDPMVAPVDAPFVPPEVAAKYKDSVHLNVLCTSSKASSSGEPQQSMCVVKPTTKEEYHTGNGDAPEHEADV